MTRRIPRIILVLALPAAAVAGTVVAQSVSAESIQSPADRTLPASTAVPVSVCPGPPTLIAPAGSVPADPGGPVVSLAVTTGSATLGGLGPAQEGGPTAPIDPQPIGRAPSADVAQTTRVLTEAGAVRMDVARTAAGARSPASSLAQAAIAASGDARGLDVTACLPSQTQAWLVGGGTADGERSRLVLTNPGTAPALLDVIVHGPDGVVPAPAGQAVVVPSGGQVALFLDALAPGLEQMAVEVSARSGRVSAVLQHSRLLGFTPGGVDDVQPSAEPATEQLIPAIAVQAPGTAAVRVAVPGDEDAVVRIGVAAAGAGTEDGPPETEPLVVTVPAGGVADVPLTGLPNGLYAASVTADIPIVAGAWMTTTLDGGELAGTAEALGRSVPPTDIAWVPATATLSGAVATAVPRPAGDGTPAVGATLVLAAPGEAAGASIRQISDTGVAAPEVPVDLAAGAVRSIDLAADTTSVLVDGATGPLVGAVVLRAGDQTGPMIAVLAVLPGPQAQPPAPEVVEDPLLGSGTTRR